MPDVTITISTAEEKVLNNMFENPETALRWYVKRYATIKAKELIYEDPTITDDPRKMDDAALAATINGMTIPTWAEVQAG